MIASLTQFLNNQCFHKNHAAVSLPHASIKCLGNLLVSIIPNDGKVTIINSIYLKKYGYPLINNISKIVNVLTNYYINCFRKWTFPMPEILDGALWTISGAILCFEEYHVLLDNGTMMFLWQAYEIISSLHPAVHQTDAYVSWIRLSAIISRACLCTGSDLIWWREVYISSANILLFGVQ